MQLESTSVSFIIVRSYYEEKTKTIVGSTRKSNFIENDLVNYEIKKCTLENYKEIIPENEN